MDEMYIRYTYSTKAIKDMVVFAFEYLNSIDIHIYSVYIYVSIILLLYYYSLFII